MPFTATNSPKVLRRPWVSIAGCRLESAMSGRSCSPVTSRQVNRRCKLARMTRFPAVAALASAVVAAASGCASPAPPPMTMNQIAARYVKLVLAVGQHDENFVDAYYGDPSWAPTGAPVPLEELAREA